VSAMNVTRVTALGIIVASPAAALTPASACQGNRVQGDLVFWQDPSDAGNGFVRYTGEAETGTKAAVVLENCTNGKALFAAAKSHNNHEAPDQFDNVRDAVGDFIDTATPYTMRQIKSGLKARGISSRIRTLKSESCGCSIYYPELRGNRKPYQ